MKKYLVSLIVMAIMINSTSVQVFAENSSNGIMKETKVETIGEIGGYLEGNIKTVKNLGQCTRYHEETIKKIEIM